MDSFQAKDNTQTEKTSGDPFASDIFADSKTKASVITEAAPTAEIEHKKTWIWRLPKAARSKIDWNQLLQNLPADFSDKLPNLLADALTNYLTFSNENSIEFFFSGNREVNENAEENDNSWLITIGIENSEANFSIEIDNAFAAWLVDAMLGAEISGTAQLRDLTVSEIAVLEFLVANLTSEANRIIKAPLFKLRSLNPSGAFNSNPVKSFPKIISTWQIVRNIQQSIVKLHITAEALRALQAGKNNLLTAAPRRIVMRESLQKRVNNVRTRIFCGEVLLALADIAGLEKGDVVLLENYDFSFNKDGVYGSSKIFLGDGKSVKINALFELSGEESLGEVEKTIIADDNKFLVRKIKYNHALRFFIESVEELETPQFAGKSMAEIAGLHDRETGEPFDESNEEAGVPLENLAVTLRVELEARRLSLAEVGNLRVSQIIELGARATDPVNLLIDDKIIARGELVEVEDQLGVRIIQIMR